MLIRTIDHIFISIMKRGRSFSSLLVIITMSFLFQDCWGEKILFFFGGGSFSHKNSAWPLVVKLAERNHEVTIISGVPKSSSTHPRIKDVVSKSLQDSINDSFGVDRFTARSEGKESDLMITYHPHCVKLCKDFLESLKTDKDTASHLFNTSYDLIIVNAIFGECGFGIGHYLGIKKTITYDSTMSLPWFAEVFGYPLGTHWIPSVHISHNRNPLTFFDRIMNLMYDSYWVWSRYNQLYPQMEKVMLDYFNLTTHPAYGDLERNSSIVLMNTHPAADFNLPFPPNIVQIAGMHLLGEEKPIPQVYQDFMDTSGPEGVVLISFGSTVNLETVPQRFQEWFFDAIEKNPKVRFLMKWKGPLPQKYSGRLNNLMPSEWLPQRELLRHPKLKVFVTHGGVNSVQEATYFGVPTIVIPLFADQDYNAYRVNSQKVGIRLEIRDLSADILHDAINRLLDNPVYKENIIRSSKIFRDRPLNAVDTALFWTEFVLRHDDLSNLKPQVNHLRWYQTRLLDVYLVILLLLSILSYIILLALHKFFQILLKSNSTPVIKQKKY